MTISKEAIKDSIRSGYDKGSKHLFVLKDEQNSEPSFYLVGQHEDTEKTRRLIIATGQQIVAELNMEVKLLLLNAIK